MYPVEMPPWEKRRRDILFLSCHSLACLQIVSATDCLVSSIKILFHSAENFVRKSSSLALQNDRNYSGMMNFAMSRELLYEVL